MKLKVIRNRLKGTDVGLPPSDMDKIEESVKEDGSVDLAEVFDVPGPAPENKLQKTVDRVMDQKGLTDERAYHKEYQLKVAHQVLINGGSTAKIAELLNVSANEARALKGELHHRLANEIRTLDKNLVAGQALMLFDHVQARFLQMAQVDPARPDANLRSKIEALKGALQTQTDKQKFLKDIGFWKEPINNSDTLSDTHVDGAMDLRNLAQAVISGEEFEIDTSDEQEQDGVELLN